MHVVRIAGPEGQNLCPRCELAESFASRLRGLMGRRALDPDAGLLLRPGGSVHTCFMRFAIDVVFLDRDLRVVGISEAVRPWRLAWARGARAILELPAGAAAAGGLAAGQGLRLEERR
jgi:hypothetical protein